MYTGLTGALMLVLPKENEEEQKAVRIAYISGWSIEDKTEIIEKTKLGIMHKEAVPSFQSWSASADGTIVFEKEGGHEILFAAKHSGTKIMLQFYLNDNTLNNAGENNVCFIGDGYIESLSVNLSAEDKGNISISIAGSGKLDLLIDGKYVVAEKHQFFLERQGSKGDKGDKGDTGKNFNYDWIFNSVAEMNVSADHAQIGDFALIQSAEGAQSKESAQVFVCKEISGVKQWQFQSDLAMRGPVPRHEWRGTTLGFENPNGDITDFVELKGEKGDTGAVPNVQIGSVTTLSQGSNATVSRAADSPDSAPKFNFGIPKGDKGDKGDQGAPGKDFTYDWVFSSVADMNGNINSAKVGDFAIIQSLLGAANEENAQVFVCKEISGVKQWQFQADFSGATGPQGEKGEKGDKGDTPKIYVTGQQTNVGGAFAVENMTTGVPYGYDAGYNFIIPEAKGADITDASTDVKGIVYLGASGGAARYGFKQDAGLSNVDNTSDANKPISTAQQAALNNKVDKVTGKGLSSEDYTSAEKSKLAGITSGAQANTVLGIKGNSESTYRIGNVNLTAANIGLSNVDNTSDANKPISTAQQAALNNKVDKVTGKGLSSEDYTSAEKSKLAGITSGANYYTHPLSHPASIITQDSNNRFVTDAEKSTWNAKAGTAVATVSGAGLMSVTDKSKLDGIASGAQPNTVLGIKGNSESTYRTGNVNLTAANIGLGNVNNTSDASKPISTAQQTALNNKVDKVTGKGLSSEDYTSADKSKLAGVAAGAQVNTVLGIKGNSESTYRVGNVNLTAGNIGAEPAFNKNGAFNKSFGTSAGSVCEGNDPRLSNDRRPLPHNHTFASISGIPTTLAGFGITDAASSAQLNNHTNNNTVHITAAERSTWNAKSNFDGNYNNLSNRPTIPSTPAGVGLGNVANERQYSANNKPTPADIGAAASSHTHSKSQITDFPSSIVTSVNGMAGAVTIPAGNGGGGLTYLTGQSGSSTYSCLSFNVPTNTPLFIKTAVSDGYQEITQHVNIVKAQTGSYVFMTPNGKTVNVYHTPSFVEISVNDSGCYVCGEIYRG